MIENVPKMIYNRDGIPMRILKSSIIYFHKYKKVGYVFHIEYEEKTTAVSEYELKYVDGKYILEREVFTNKFEM